MHVLVAGAGWLGSAIGGALVARGDRVTAVRRQAAGLEPLRSAGLGAVACDLADPRSFERLPADVEAIVACQSAGVHGSEDASRAYETAYLDVNRALLDYARRIGVRGFVYTSSTGVFGQRDGSSVDEGTPPLPVDGAAHVLVEAERLVLGAASGRLRSCVVRLSGLYGPGRCGIIDRVRRGALALGPDEGCFMNFCHRDDAVAAVLALLDRGRPGGVYHASDSCPTPRGEVVRWIAGRLQIEPRRAEEGRPASANRRISAERTRRELGLTLAYPSFREGLAPLFG